MNHFLRYLFFALFVKPLVLIVLGVNVRRLEKLLAARPAIVVANHNSHLDTMVLMTLFPLRMLKYVRPAAAADYFLRNRFLAWFALRIIGIVPVSRRVASVKQDPLAGCCEALDSGGVLVFFPEGTRGEPERLATFKSGIAHLAKRFPDVPVVPVFMHGLGKALPRGEGLLVPFFCDVFVGEPLYWAGDRSCFMGNIDASMQALAEEGQFPPWE